MLKFKEGSSAENGKDEVVFLIGQINTIGEYTGKYDWFRSVKGWQSLDEAQIIFGNCQIVKSIPAKEYDNFCESN